MTVELVALRIGARDPDRLATFWGAMLHHAVAPDVDGGAALVSPGGAGFSVRFRPDQGRRSGPNQMHPDLTSTSAADQTRMVERALGLGARHRDVGQRPEEGHVVLADPEGNEFCIIGPGNGFLAGCGLLGALAGDGSRATGEFWSQALGWPLVWDEGEETAIQSPSGGTKLSWGGPPLRPRAGPERWRLEISPVGGGDLEAAVEGLVRLGATRVAALGHGDGVVLADPDGHELHVTARERFGVQGDDRTADVGPGLPPWGR